ncbi:putative reverse transcriptase zinc-binding domain-containing protein [Helianthus annuus]|nr:putative reverse transcriptase zinc-binding domain-containing protein [Helianthus annuus]KAJ0706721.1 putative reverse transcriptase zinc-binding domain-containing protein [Helianthus annuus]KAJ0710756.1 putative reverse transcriptase zinc-binding domain-containing protein [Helianthus annuus]
MFVNYLILYTLLTFSLSFPATSAINYNVINLSPNIPGGIRFTKEIGIPFTKKIMRTINDFIWSTLFQQNTPADRKPLDCVNVYIVEFDGAEGVQWGSYNINVSSIFLKGYEEDLRWKDLDGNSCHFSSWEVWNNIRQRESLVSWVNMVWFKHCIPRHSFHLWLVIRNKLKTQDRLSVWEAGSATNLNLMCCPLCYHDRDSRDHLFFECSYALQVWNNVKTWTNMNSVNGSWAEILSWMNQNSNMQVPENIISRLVLSAASYFVWQERNNRLFSRSHRTEMVIAREIIRTVRLRLLSFKFKWHPSIRRLLEKWQIPSGNMVIDPG